MKLYFQAVGIALLYAIAVFQLTASAATTNWINSSGGSWLDASNWDNGSAGAGDFARFPSDSNIVTLSSNRTVTDLQVGGNSGQADVFFDLLGKTLTVTNEVQIALSTTPFGSRDGNLILSGEGTLDVQGIVDIGINPNAANEGIGILQLDNSATLETATLDIDSGAVTIGNGGSILAANVFAQSGTILVAVGGQLNASNLTLQDFGDGNSRLTVSGGAVSIGSLNEDITHPASDGIQINLTSGSIVAGTFTYDANVSSLNHASGTLTIDGGNFENGGGNLTVSASGTPQMDFLNGASASQSSLTAGLSDGGGIELDGSGTQVDVGVDVHVGRFIGSEGRLGVGNSAVLDIGDDLLLGNGGGSGLMTISNGGVVNVTDQTFVGRLNGSSSTLSMASGGSLNGQGRIRIAVGTGSEGHVNVDGDGTEINIGQISGIGGIWVGAGGTGTLTVSDDASVLAEEAILVGQTSSSDGTVTVSDGGTVRTRGSLDIGVAGIGRLNVIGGQATSNSSISIGDQVGSTGQVTVSGSTSRLESGLRLWVGIAGHGSLEVENGGTVTTSAQLYVGRDTGSTGMLSIDGGTVLANDSIYLGGNETVAGGQGTLAVSSGNIIVDQEITIWGDGTLNLSGGLLSATKIDHRQGGAFNFSDGELSVENFDGDLEQQGGTLSPGDSPGSTTITGDYSMVAGILEIEIGGHTAGSEYDQLAVDGTATIDGMIDISLINGFEPELGDIFKVLDANILSGEFTGLSEGSTLTADGVEFDITYLGGGGTNVELVVTGFSDNANFDGDFDVDGDDLTLWESNYGVSVASPADADHDGDSDGADFLIWQRQYTGNITVALPSTSVPEPTSCVLVFLGITILRLSRFQTC